MSGQHLKGANPLCPWHRHSRACSGSSETQADLPRQKLDLQQTVWRPVLRELTGLVFQRLLAVPP